MAISAFLRCILIDLLLHLDIETGITGLQLIAHCLQLPFLLRLVDPDGILVLHDLLGSRLAAQHLLFDRGCTGSIEVLADFVNSGVERFFVF